MDVSTNSAFANQVGSTLVTWDFPNATDDAIADGGITVNLTNQIAKLGGSAPTFATAGATTRSATASGWDSGSGTKCWVVHFIQLVTQPSLSVRNSGHRVPGRGTGNCSIRLGARTGPGPM